MTNVYVIVADYYDHYDKREQNIFVYKNKTDALDFLSELQQKWCNARRQNINDYVIAVNSELTFCAYHTNTYDSCELQIIEKELN